MDDDRLAGLWEDAAAEPEAAAEPAEIAAPEPAASAEPTQPTPEQEEAEPDAVETTAGKMVPVHALTAARKDYKGQLAAKAEEFARADEQLKAERAAKADLQRQLDELKRGTPAAPAPTPQSVAEPDLPDPVTHPREYAAAIRAETAQRAFNDRLNLSEWTYQQAHPDADTKAVATRFQAEVAKNPMLATQMRQHPHPYQFAADTIARADALATIGADPAAWMAAERERLKAEFAAERESTVVPQQQAAVAKAVPVLPVSLATARNAPPRAGTPDADEDLLSAVVRKR